MPTAKLGVLIVCGMFVCSRPVAAVLVDKILAVVNGELLTLQDFEDHLALSRIYQPEVADVDRQQAFQRFVDQTLVRQEALRTRIVQVDEVEVSRYLRELNQQLEGGQELVRVMQERGLSQRDVRAWLRDQLIVRAFIDRRVRLFVRVPDSQIVHYYQHHRQAIGEPLDEAVREQIQRLLTERQVNIRLTALIEELRKKGHLDFPP
jgi:peptidyl-prolyl cis-trans isomerase SurA